MKKKFLFVFILLSAFTAFAQNYIEDVMLTYDSILEGRNEKALVTIGFITYEDSNTCGTIVPYIQEQIKKHSENLQYIKIVKTTELSEYEQSGIATRGLSRGIGDDNSTDTQNKYIIDGKYYAEKDYILLELTMHDVDGKVSELGVAVISYKEAEGYTLYPANINLAQTVQQDFDKTNDEINQKDSTKSDKKNSETKKTETPTRINIAASMLDSDGNLVNMLHPNDIVRFKINADMDCYIAILCIDANGEKTWLPTTSNFMEANTPRMFPDISGAVLRVANDGVFGAEQVIIYASTSKDSLPSQGDNGKYSSQDLHMIMKNQQNAKKDKSNKSGTFKITYTIIQ